MIRELTQPEIEELLTSEVVARVGCYAHGQIYVVPISYAYVDGAIVAHSVEGMKVRFLRASPEACVEVDRMEGPSTWRSVIGWGRYEELAGDEARAAMTALIDRLSTGRLAPRAPTRTADPASAGVNPALAGGTVGRPGVVFRIRLQRCTGRAERGSGLPHPLPGA